MTVRLIAALALAGAFFYALPAQARGSHHHSKHHHAKHRIHHRHHVHFRVVHHRRKARRRQSDPRPAAWCGFYARHNLVSVDPGRSFNLARNWAHWGSNAGGPRVGAIVVWSHHVGRIVGREGGQWIVRSGNDGHRVRTRPRSLRGAIAFRVPVQRFAGR